MPTRPTSPRPSDLPPIHSLPDPTAHSSDPFPLPPQSKSVAVEMVEQLTLSSLRSRSAAEHLIHTDPELNTAADLALYNMMEALHTSMRIQNILLATQIQAQTSTFVMPMNFIPAVSKDMDDVS